MKNKIIFKTLMLKGEAGSTIVSMEKTGHVGTADIYTITFNDGSTTEISLENMSAITSVEKTSSTDTEDIYTITCADGSTQTFSVLNHNADFAAMSDEIADELDGMSDEIAEIRSDVESDISVIDARVDNLVTDVNGAEVTTLWTGSLGTLNTPVTLSQSVSNFDFIDIYTLNGADTTFTRVPANVGTAQIHVGNLSDDASVDFLQYGEMGISLSGTSATLTKAVAFQWSPPASPEVTDDTTIAVVTRIDGVKTSASVNAELADLRVGANGVTYESAGAAVRGQIGDLKEDLANINLSSIKFFPRHLGVINADGSAWIYTSDSNWQYTIIPITAYSKIYIKASGLNVVWAFLKSYDPSSAPDLSSATSTRQNNDYNGVVPSDASYLYLQLKYIGADTIPPHLIIDGWDYGISAKAQLLSDLDTLSDAVLSNTPIDIIKSNALVIQKTSWTSGTVNVGFEDPDIIVLGGSYSSGAQRITPLTAVLKANTKYTFFVKNIDGLKPSVGLASSAGFINYNGNKVETSDWNKPVVFETSSSELTGVYAYLRVTASALNNKLEIYVIEGEHSAEEFYIYGNEYKASRLNGKKVAWYGDSITQGYAWCTTLNGLFNFDAVNCGSGGCRISYTSSRNDSMCLATRMQGDYTPTSGTATAIPDDVDIIFVEGGTNDWGNNVAIGEPVWKETPDYTVFAEACNDMFDNLTTLFPNAEIIVLGSPWAKWANHFTDDYGILNNNGLQTVDYGDILLDVAGRWGIKGINMSRIIGFNDNNIANLTSDGIHPNSSGSALIAGAVAEYLLSL